MNIESKIKYLVEFIKNKEIIKKYVFLSLGKPNVKAQVKIIKRTNYLEREIIKICQKYKKQAGEFPTWIKLDIVTNYETVLFKDLKKK